MVTLLQFSTGWSECVDGLIMLFLLGLRYRKFLATNNEGYLKNSE